MSRMPSSCIPGEGRQRLQACGSSGCPAQPRLPPSGIRCCPPLPLPRPAHAAHITSGKGCSTPGPSVFHHSSNFIKSSLHSLVICGRGSGPGGSEGPVGARQAARRAPSSAAPQQGGRPGGTQLGEQSSKRACSGGGRPSLPAPGRRGSPGCTRRGRASLPPGAAKCPCRTHSASFGRHRKFQSPGPCRH